MVTFRSMILNTLRIPSDYSVLSAKVIHVERVGECEPFAEIVTTQTGRTVFRAGQTLRKCDTLKVID